MDADTLMQGGGLLGFGWVVWSTLRDLGARLDTTLQAHARALADIAAELRVLSERERERGDRPTPRPLPAPRDASALSR